MRNIFVFIFSLLLCSKLFAINPETEVHRALRVGIDLSRYGFYAAGGNFLSNEFTIDYYWKNNNFLVWDLGTMSGSKKSDNYLLRANGVYSRIGLDHNFLKHPSDVLSIGTRLGFSKYRYRPTQVVFPDPFWGNYLAEPEQQNMSAFWIEAVFGIKTEIFSNLFLGWSVSARVMLFSLGSEYFPEYKVPGFGTHKGSISPGFGFYVYYRLPLIMKTSLRN